MADIEPLLTSDDDDTEWIREVESRRAQRNSDSTHVKRPGNIPPIPDGKKYHLFISHSNDDQEEVTWAERAIDTMEQQGYKCLWPRRDFTPGHEIARLIQEGIACSMRILCVLTPASLASGWCEYERNLAFILSVEGRNNRVIPLVLQECVVPDIFKTINYIDVVKGEDYMQRIERCFDEHRDMTDIIPNMEYLVRRLDNTRNGLNMTEIVPNSDTGRQIKLLGKKVLPKRGSAWTFMDLLPVQRESFSALNPNFEDVYSSATSIVNKSQHLKYYSLSHSYCHAPCSCLFVFLAVVLPIMLATYLVEISQQMIILSGTVTSAKVYMVGGLLAVVGFILVVVMIVYHMKTFTKVKSQILNFSLQQVMETKLLVNYQRTSGGPPIIQLMSYDVEPCVEYLSQRILQQSTNFDDTCEEKKKEARRKAEGSVLNYIRTNNDKIFDWTGLQVTGSNRHPTFQSRACLCEMITWDVPNKL